MLLQSVTYLYTYNHFKLTISEGNKKRDFNASNKMVRGHELSFKSPPPNFNILQKKTKSLANIESLEVFYLSQQIKILLLGIP